MAKSCKKVRKDCWENQNNLRHLTGVAKLKIKNFRKKRGEYNVIEVMGMRGECWQTDTTEPPPLS